MEKILAPEMLKAMEGFENKFQGVEFTLINWEPVVGPLVGGMVNE